MNISNLLNNETFEQDFYTFSSSPTRPVVVKWGGSGIHEITGPTPFLDISKSFNNNEAGVLESIVHTINLNGKIYYTGIVGIGGVVSGIAKLENLFKGCPTSTLEIFCDNTLLWSATGVQVKGMSFNKTDDNWVKSADYSIDLEYKTGATNDPDDQVEERNDSWSIEPLDDIIYTKFASFVSQKPEIHNPKMKPRAPSSSNPVPGQSVGGGAFGATNPENSIQFFSIPQFRISRRLSARGLPIPPPSGAGQACLDPKRAKAEEKKFFLNAKTWVDKQSKLAFNGSMATGSIFFTTTPEAFDYKGTWLYNHNRTINADVYNSSYEVNDTWIAMPTGISYIETFTIEASTDSNNTKTVRVAGNIQGLTITPKHISKADKGPFPSGTGSLSASNNSDGASGSMRLDLSYSMETPPAVTIDQHKIPSLTQNQAFGGGGVDSNIDTIQSTKYLNAFEAWINDIKPYLYRRACLGINSYDREQPEPPAPPQNPPKPPQNPVFLVENLLNVIPTSTSEGHDPLKGTISYSHEFDNKLLTISGVLSENINISNTAPAYSIQETQIIGRALGPILYAAGVTNPRKSINIDIVVPKGTGIKSQFMTEPTCPLYVSGYFWKTVDSLIEGHAPFTNRTIALFDNAKSQLYGTVFKDSDSEQWNPTEGRYSRNVSWIYQQCTTNKMYYDH